MEKTVYLIQSIDNPNMYWAGDCKFGEIQLNTKKWTGPDNGFYPQITGDGVQWYNTPPTPYSFDSLDKAEEVLKYVPRVFNVRVVVVKIETSNVIIN